MLFPHHSCPNDERSSPYCTVNVNSPVSLFNDQAILYGFDPFDASGDFTRFVDSFLRINGAAQLNVALERFDTDLE